MIIEYKDDATAFNARKRGTIAGKGACNNQISATLFRVVEAAGVATHFVDQLDETRTLARKVRIVPIELVVRNIAAGSLSQRLGLPEGTPLPCTVVETYYKNDALGDPLLNRYHVRALGLATDAQLDAMEAAALTVNRALRGYLRERGLDLVDFKLEFGVDPGGALLLADEISPDTCRFWDTATGEKLDKDRFRWDLGGVEAAYQEVLRRVTREAPAPGAAAGADSKG